MYTRFKQQQDMNLIVLEGPTIDQDILDIGVTDVHLENIEVEVDRDILLIQDLRPEAQVNIPVIQNLEVVADRSSQGSANLPSLPMLGVLRTTLRTCVKTQIY